MLEVSGLARRFGDITALDDVSFHVDAGEILGLVGPNGSGKTTLLECLCGLQPLAQGRIAWQGAELAAGRRKSVMFFVPDGIAPYPDHVTRDALRFFASAFSRVSSDIDEVVDALALAPAIDKRVGALSKGFRKRLLIAIGLLSSHPLLLIDEPFDGLDLRQTRDATELLRRSITVKRTLLLSIHQLTDAERICDRFVMLSNGRVRGEGRLDELRSSAKLAHGTLEDVFLALT